MAQATHTGGRDDDEIRLVLVGRTGAGKSATGNTLLGKKEFVSKPSGSSVTEKCQVGKGQYTGRKLHLVDTPGLFDTKLPPGEITKEIIRCIHMSTPGPHVFLLVLRVDRFTNEEIQTFNSLFEIFGEKMNNFAIITFTRLDDLEQDNVSIDAFVDGSNKELKDFVERCQYRYIAFNNRCSEKEKREKVSEFMDLINEILKNNNGQHYSNAMYKEAEANLQSKIREVKRIKALEKAKEVERIESKFKGEMTRIEEKSQKLQEQLIQQHEETQQISKKRDETEAALNNIQKQMESLNSEHEKELFKIKEEDKKRTEIQLENMRTKELELQRLQMEMQNQQTITLEKMKEMERDRHVSMKSIEDKFDKLLKNAVEDTRKSHEEINWWKREMEKKEENYEKILAQRDAHNFQLEQGFQTLQKNMDDKYANLEAQRLEDQKMYKEELKRKEEEHKAQQQQERTQHNAYIEDMKSYKQTMTKQAQMYQAAIDSRNTTIDQLKKQKQNSSCVLL